MLFINAIYPDKNFNMVKGDIEIDDGIIKNVGQNLPYTNSDTVVDCEGFYITPGFIDVHIHGCVGKDASDGDEEGVLAMAKHLLSVGVTSFCPTVMSLKQEHTENALISIKNAAEKQTEGATIVGINLEGPFFAKSKKGAQPEDAIIDPDFDLIKRYFELSGKKIKISNVAPELDGALSFIEKTSKLCTVSIAHTSAKYDEAILGFKKGARSATHLFNAMTGLHHREPGVVGAVLDCDSAMAEMVCDGHHLHPAVVRSMFKFIGERLLVVSDSMRLAGFGEGESGTLGGQTVFVKNNTARLEDGTIAGSVTDMHAEFLNLLSWGVPMGQALRALCINPAKLIEMDSTIGSIEIGKKADLLVLDEEYNISAVYH